MPAYWPQDKPKLFSTTCEIYAPQQQQPVITFAVMPPINWGEILLYFFIAVTAIQLFYYGWFFSRVAFFKPKAKVQSQQHPVSVIICSRDEDENLARNLPGVLVQQYSSSHEVVVVNDNSLDDSKYILQELKKTFKSLHVVELTQEAVLLVSEKQSMKYCCLLTPIVCPPANTGYKKCRTGMIRILK